VLNIYSLNKYLLDQMSMKPAGLHVSSLVVLRRDGCGDGARPNCSFVRFRSISTGARILLTNTLIYPKGTRPFWLRRICLRFQSRTTQFWVCNTGSWQMADDWTNNPLLLVGRLPAPGRREIGKSEFVNLRQRDGSPVHKVSACECRATRSSRSGRIAFFLSFL
jgi:hypothetical protein